MRKCKWTEDQLRQAAQGSKSIRQVLQKLGLIEAGGNYYQIKKYLHFYNVDTAHFNGKGWRKGFTNPVIPKIPTEKILVRNSSFQSYKVKLRLFEEQLKERRCELCDWAEVSVDGRVPLELDHINGDHFDNRLENLRVLCPNCHSLQPNHRARNMSKKKLGPVVEWYTRST